MASSAVGGGELEGLMRGLRLSEEERRGVRGAHHGTAADSDRVPQAVGKLFSNPVGQVDGLVQTLGRIWCPMQGIRCKDLGGNLFLFTFLQPGGKRRTAMEGPWDFGGDLLIVVDVDGSKRLKDLEFNFIPVWVQIFDLPLGMINSEIGQKIGNKVGKTLVVDAEEDGMAVGSFLRVKMHIDIRKPLMRGIVLEDENGRSGAWCPFQYEFLPNFYYGCGRLGHVEKDCDVAVGDEACERQYNDWLRAHTTKARMPAESRSQWSGGGGSLGGSKQGRSGENWQSNFGKDKERSMAASWRNQARSDQELRDDGTSLVKIPLAAGEMLLLSGKPRSISFEECVGEEARREQSRTGHREGIIQPVQDTGKGFAEGNAGNLETPGGEDKEGDATMQRPMQDAAVYQELGKATEVDKEVQCGMVQEDRQGGTDLRKGRWKREKV